MNAKVIFASLLVLTIVHQGKPVYIPNFSVFPEALLFTLPFTVTGISSGTLAALGGLKLLAAVAVALASGKRDLSNPLSEKLGNMDLYFHMINEVDHQRCALRLICELETMEEDKLEYDERLIKALFGAKPKNISYQELKTPKGAYEYAAYLGSTTQSRQACSTIYSKCPYATEQMMSALRTASSATYQQKQQTQP
uniref:Uncharacterized protein n=1 Tax=Strigamia maritima TaxID=126957 RepID=T1IRR4_STRMM